MKKSRFNQMKVRVLIFSYLQTTKVEMVSEPASRL